jgi:hypothetical protein
MLTVSFVRQSHLWHISKQAVVVVVVVAILNVNQAIIY